MPADRTITEYSVEFHGLQHPDSFQGAGTFDGSQWWEATGTGVGDSTLEALENALDQLAEMGWDVGTVGVEEIRGLRDGSIQWDDIDAFGEHYVYVSVRVR